MGIVKEIMSQDLITLKKDATIFSAIGALCEHSISGILIVDDEKKLLGVLSEYDVLDLLAKGNFNKEDIVENFMTKDVVSFPEDASLLDICSYFLEKNIRRVPILSDGFLVGVISRHDIINLIFNADGNTSVLKG